MQSGMQPCPPELEPLAVLALPVAPLDDASLVPDEAAPAVPAPAALADDALACVPPVPAPPTPCAAGRPEHAARSIGAAAMSARWTIPCSVIRTSPRQGKARLDETYQPDGALSMRGPVRAPGPAVRETRRPWPGRIHGPGSASKPGHPRATGLGLVSSSPWPAREPTTTGSPRAPGAGKSTGASTSTSTAAWWAASQRRACTPRRPPPPSRPSSPRRRRRTHRQRLPMR
jgi:hypothetical protein